jgi:hypothetical protein
VSVTNKPQKLKVRRLLEDLNSGNETKISSALKALQLNGDSSVLNPIADLLKTDISAKNRQEIIDFLSCLNDSSTIDSMIEIVKDSNYLSIRQELLSTMWNNKLDYTYFLPEFVEIAVEGSFMEALECLTIIENLEGPFEERHILESQLHLKEYINDKSPKDPQKAQIMSEIALLIKDYDLMDEDDNIDFFNE